ncbi:MAG: pyridoxamine 5'-phosphate oxidase family protein [Acidimicrobiales bacterium]
MADEPHASRPFMPGYGIRGPTQGTGLLPWSWATERLSGSHDYWVATTRSNGRPHVMPVWGVWWAGALWFSSGLRSRKARNLAANPRCTITTDNALEPVVLEGTAATVREADAIRGFAERLGAKYETDYGVDLFDPDVNGTYRVSPTWVFGLLESDFEGSPTRWDFALRP